MERYIQIGYFILFAAANVALSQQSNGAMCSQLYRMSEVCFRESGSQPNVIQGRVGKSGPRGLRGPPGRNAEVDYDKIDAIISEKYEGLEALKDRVAKLEELQSWYKASNGKLYKLFRERMNYDAAKLKCKEHGAILASAGVRNVHTRWELLNLVKSGGGNTWVGQNDRQQEGRWVWEDGVVATLEDADWLDGQPSNYGGREHCGHYWMERDYKINDTGCESMMFVLCEKSE